MKYIPQHYLEDICVDTKDFDSSGFKSELEGVIFSHIDDSDKLSLPDMRSLIDHHTAVSNKTIDSLRSKLRFKNLEIIELESQIHPATIKSINNKLAAKTHELEQHDIIIPVEVPKPDSDGDDELETAIEILRSQQIELSEKYSGLLEQKQQSTLRNSQAVSLLDYVKEYQRQTQQFLLDTKDMFAQLDIDQDSVIDSNNVKTNIIEEIVIATQAEIDRIDADFDVDIKDSIAFQIKRCTNEIESRQEQLDEPSKKYQSYLDSHSKWLAERDKIIGSKDIPDSLEFHKHTLANLSDTQLYLNGVRQERLNITRRIHQEFVQQVERLRILYAPAQQALNDHELAEGRFSLELDVSILEHEFALTLISFIRQNTAKSKFYGKDDGEAYLKKQLKKSSFDSEDDAILFIESIAQDIIEPDADASHVGGILGTLLKKNIEISQVYQFLFGLEFLRTRFVLNWSGEKMATFSPGERGIVLLVFYLILDKDTKPLIIDQPEENLGNQSIYSILVPCMKYAKNLRQIIMVTHNPNLAVVCDAEQIIYCSIDKGERPAISYHPGSIENSELNQSVIDVLEGTMPAFDNRNIKYQRI